VLSRTGHFYRKSYSEIEPVEKVIRPLRNNATGGKMVECPPQYVMIE
jgi:hypothetical protein